MTLTDDAPIVGVAFDATGRLVATLGEDGNEDLWDAQTGERVATLVNLVELGIVRRRRVARRHARRACSTARPGRGSRSCGGSRENTFDVGPVEIFFNELYYPSLLSDIFAGKRPKAPRSLPQIDRRQPELHVTLDSPAAGDVAPRTVAVTIDVAELPADATHPQGSGAQDVRLFRNGTLVKVWRGDVLKGQPRARLQATLPIVAGPNRLTAYAFNRDNVKSADAFVAVNGSAQLARKGVAYVLAVRRQRVRQSAVQPQIRRSPMPSRSPSEAETQAAKLERSSASRSCRPARPARHQGQLPGGAEPARDAAPTRPRGAARHWPGCSGRSPRMPSPSTSPATARRKGPRFYLVPHDLGYAGAARAASAPRSVDAILSPQRLGPRDSKRPSKGSTPSQVVLVDRRLQLRPGARSRGAPARADELEGAGAAGLREGHVHPHRRPELSGGARDRAARPRLPDLRPRRGGLEEGPGRPADEGRRGHRCASGSTTRPIACPRCRTAADGSRLLLLQDDKAGDPNVVRSLQRPRAFYRREVELRPVIVARP